MINFDLANERIENLQNPIFEYLVKRAKEDKLIDLYQMEKEGDADDEQPRIL